MKKFLAFLLVIGSLYYLIMNYSDEIIDYGLQLIIFNEKVVVPEHNVYRKETNYHFVQNTTNFEPSNRQDLINIYFTTINSGWDEFTFYCRRNYPSCIEDVKEIANDKTLLSHINNFVHPYNSFSEIKTKYDNYGTVKISTTKTYNDDKIALIDNRINEIYNQIINDTMTIEQKIRTIHDYIINNTKYDSERFKNNIEKYDSDTSYGVLFQGYGFCSGYTDTMAIFLNKLGVNNYKIASERHIWNFVNLGDKWYHLDVSWNDPVSDTGKDILDHTFFLIDTQKLESLSVEEHIYDKEVYYEAK